MDKAGSRKAAGRIKILFLLGDIHIPPFFLRAKSTPYPHNPPLMNEGGETHPLRAIQEFLFP